MKTTMITLLTLCVSFSAFAEEVLVMKQRVFLYGGAPQASAKFFMDTNTGEGNAVVSIVTYERDIFPGPIGGCDQWGRCYPTPRPVPRSSTEFRETALIENLNLVNKQMIYNGVNGEVNCGRLGRSRVLNRPTLFLSGKCKLEARLRGDVLTVTLKIK